MTRAPLTAHQARARYKRPKYGNEKVGGFDSVLERMHNDELEWLQKLGVISDLKKQVPFVLQESFKRDGKTIRAISYVADFSYMRDGKLHVDECKGYQTEVSKLKMKLFAAKFPDVVLRIVRKK